MLTAKRSERGLWESRCRATGRLADLRVISPSEPWRFDFLKYEFNRKGPGAGQTYGTVQMLLTLLEVADRSGGGGRRDSEPYWARACAQLMHNLTDLVSMGTGEVSISDLYKAAITAPTSSEQLRSDQWKAESFCFQCLNAADKRPKTAVQRRDLGIVADYFLTEYVKLSDKTRSVILSTFTSMVDVLNRGILRELFCGETNITPEDTENGCIIVIDIPSKEWNAVGILGQVIWKTAFQRWVERRTVTADTRPVFLFADEAPNWVTSGDAAFQSTARSSNLLSA